MTFQSACNKSLSTIARELFQVCGDAHEDLWSTWHVLWGLEYAVLAEVDPSQDATVRMRRAR